MHDKIKNVLNIWFFSEPALYQMVFTHEFVENTNIDIPMRVGKGKIEYNPSIIEGLSTTRISDILKAEMVRVFLKHPYTRKPINMDAIIPSIGSDMVISDNYNMLDGVVATVGNFNKKLSKSDIETLSTEKLSYEQRCQELWKILPKSPMGLGGGEGNSTETSQMRKEMSQKCELWSEDTFMQECINSKIKSIRDGSWGSLSGDIEELIKESTNAQVDYRKILRNFATSSLDSHRILTRMRPSRRFGFDYMGSKYELRSKLLIAVDTSGSISSEDLGRFFHIIKQFCTYGYDNADVVQVDTDIKSVMTTKDVKNLMSQNKMRSFGRGGTDFNCVFEWIKKERKSYDGIIFLSDGDVSEPDINFMLKSKIVWIFTDKDTYERNNKRLSNNGKCCFIEF